VLVLASGSVEFAIVNAPRGLTITVTALCQLGLAALVAVMVTEVLLVTLGAAKAPLLEIVPVLADQVTAVFGVPLTLAVNCCCPSEIRLAMLGEIEIVAPVSPVDVLFDVLLAPCDGVAHAVVKTAMQSKSERTRKFGIRSLSAR